MNITPRDLGVPVKSINWPRLFAGRRSNGEPLLLMSAGQDAGGLFVSDIDPETGHCTQYPVNLPYAAFPTAFYFSARTGVLYIGSAYTGHLHRYDANLPVAERHLEDLGATHPELCKFPCGIDEAPDGSIYIGANPGCCLARFDPDTGVLTRFGRMDESEMYLYPLCGADGTVGAMVRTREPHVVVFDPVTGEHFEVGPRANEETGIKTVELKKGDDGLLYIVSDAGNFRLQGMEAIPVDEVPAALPPSSLPDGSIVEFDNGHINNYRVLSLQKPDGARRTLKIDWEGNGTSIFLVHEGPDGNSYGSSILPEHLFVCNPDGSELKDLGACSESIGEAYSMGNYEGKLYIASYPRSRISIYDPSLPYRYGTDEDSNPRDIGSLDEVSLRPRAMLPGPAGKVWIGSFPDYGIWGGTLIWYEPATGKSQSHRHLVQDCSVTALEWIPELNFILTGTSIVGGNGTVPRAKTAPFVLWDPHRDCAVETLDFGVGTIHSALDLKYAGDGKVYAVVALETGPGQLCAELVLIDIVNRHVLSRSLLGKPDTIGWPVEVSLRNGPNGIIYGCCHGEFYRIEPGTTQREILWSTTWENDQELIHAGGALVGNTYYYGSWHYLRAFDIPTDN